MRRSTLSRRSAAFVVAVGLHVLLAVLVVSRMAPPPPGDLPAMQVTLLTLPPRSEPARPPPPPRLAGGSPAPAAAPRASAAPTTRPSAVAAPADTWRVRPGEAAEDGAARTTLRGKLGCRTADLLALTKAERAACQEALAKGAETAPTYAVVSPKLRKVFDGAFECPKGDVWCEYRIGKGPYPGLLAPRKPPRDRSWDQ